MQTKPACNGKFPLVQHHTCDFYSWITLLYFRNPKIRIIANSFRPEEGLEYVSCYNFEFYKDSGSSYFIPPN